MNAYKLADEVMEHYNAEKQKGFNVNWMQEVANMLRQQADLIEQLEKQNQVLRENIERLFGGLETMTNFSKALMERDK